VAATAAPLTKFSGLQPQSAFCNITLDLGDKTIVENIGLEVKPRGRAAAVAPLSGFASWSARPAPGLETRSRHPSGLPIGKIHFRGPPQSAFALQR
jgi:hypothetical protein